MTTTVLTRGYEWSDGHLHNWGYEGIDVDRLASDVLDAFHEREPLVQWIPSLGEVWADVDDLDAIDADRLAESRDAAIAGVEESIEAYV